MTKSPAGSIHKHDPELEASVGKDGIDYTRVNLLRNTSVAKLYEDALRYEPGTSISSAGALVTSSGKKTGRSPRDKRIRLYVFDGFAGWDPKYRLKIRVVCARAYHSLFMHNMLIRPTEEELKNYGEPDFTILNAGAFPANRYTTGMTSNTS
ncbi:Protein kinase C-like 1, partial [Mortierella sp. AD031]